jgi:hypothetical protein
MIAPVEALNTSFICCGILYVSCKYICSFRNYYSCDVVASEVTRELIAGQPWFYYQHGGNPSRTVLGLTQPPIYWALSYQEVKIAWA